MGHYRDLKSARYNGNSPSRSFDKRRIPLLGMGEDFCSFGASNH